MVATEISQPRVLCVVDQYRQKAVHFEPVLAQCQQHIFLNASLQVETISDLVLIGHEVGHFAQVLDIGHRVEDHPGVYSQCKHPDTDDGPIKDQSACF